MRRGITFIFLFCFLSGFTQTTPSKYWVKFKNKNGTPFSISNPSAFLSQRAIDRRVKQAISIANNDLPITPSYITSVLSTGSITLFNRSKWFNSITIYTTDSLALVAINNLSFVDQIEPVGMIKWKDDLENTFATNKKESTIVQPPLAYDYGSSYTQVNMIGIDCMHSDGYNGQGLVIAVLDAGFYNVDSMAAFDSLRIHNQILGTKDYVTGDSLVYEDASHGMHVLSTMGAELPGQMIGTAPNAQYWLLRTEEAVSENMVEEDNWVAAAEFADSAGADIINSSLGYTTFDDPSQNHTYADLDGNTARITIGADIAASKGMVVVSSAGNDGPGFIGAPADGDSVLTIGAVDAARLYASFSSVGPSSDGRIKPNVAALGRGTTIALSSGGVSLGSGTSFASPLIAGAVACLWQANPGASNMQLIQAIQQSGHHSGDPDNLLGYGIPDFCIANQLLAGVSPEKFTEDNIVRIYPTPFVDAFEFSFYSSEKQNIRIELTDIRGRTIMYDERATGENSYNKYTVNDLSVLASGVYLFTVYSTDHKRVYKVMKK